jgi:hypothetical protein
VTAIPARERFGSRGIRASFVLIRGDRLPLQTAIAMHRTGFVYFRAVVSAFHGANLVRLGKTQKASR